MPTEANWTTLAGLCVLLFLSMLFPGGEQSKPTENPKVNDDSKKIDLGREPRSPAEVFKDPPGFGADRFLEMWSQQKAFMHLLQEKRGFPQFPTDITSKAGQQFLKGITHHMMDELFEAGQHLKNAKSHRATEVPEVDREAFKEELVDALHLYLELVIAAGITPHELFEAYMKKGETNFKRINGGY